jgi:chromosomal replication initiator protein
VLEQWQQCIDQLEREISPQLFRTWIRPLVFLGCETSSGTVRIGCPNAFKLNWVRQQWGQRLESMLRSDPSGTNPLTLQFEVCSYAVASAAQASHLPEIEDARDHGDTAPSKRDADVRSVESATTRAHHASHHAHHDTTPNTDHDRTCSATEGTHHNTTRNAEHGETSSAKFNARRRPATSGTTAANAALDDTREDKLTVATETTTSSQNADPAAQKLNRIPERMPTPEKTRLPQDAAKVPGTPLNAARQPRSTPHQPGIERPGEVRSPINSNLLDEWSQSSKLNRELSFENFVIGKSNQMARAAALQVSQRPGLEYNPLFIYGGVGLGKTHLMHAVGNALRELATGRDAHRPKVRVRYIHAQEFFDEMVRSIQRKNSEEMRAQYQKLDLFLIDDIQFLSNKPRTQEEFFYLFEALFAARKQIILTCDTYPKEMSGVEERLVSRFDSGLIVAIEPPDLETRTAILHRKAELRQVHLPDDVAFFVAKNLRSNVRELEGALNRLVAASSFRSAQICLELAKEALQDLLDLNRPAISIETIQKTVADYYKLKIADMYSKRRPAHIALARQVAMYMAKELTQKSLPEIGELFGGRDHTTVLYAVRKISERRMHETELNHALKVLEQTLRS